MAPKNVLILVNKQTTIVNFRLEVVEALVKEGYNVYVSVPDGDRLPEIEKVGAKVIKIKMNKNSTNPVKDLALFIKYLILIRKIKADVVLTYTIKPNIYGGMAAALNNVPYISNITGLGTALANKGMLQKITVLLYKIAFCRIHRVFFQNAENRQFFEEHNIAKGKYSLLPGSGVNLKKFHMTDYPDEDVIKFAFISRIMKEKGIEEYLTTAQELKKKYSNIEFHVVGFGDEYYEQKMRKLHNSGLICYHGLSNDVREVIKDIHCVIHPTFYPEGMSNILLESAASCRPIISTDRAGCREAIEDGINGYLVKEQDAEDLVDKTEKFLLLPYEQKQEMGIKGRKKVEKEFDRNIIVSRYIDTLRDLFD